MAWVPSENCRLRAMRTPAVRGELESVVGDRRAEHIFEQGQAAGVVQGASAGAGVQIEAAIGDHQPAEYLGVVVGCACQAHRAAVQGRSGRSKAADGGGGELGQGWVSLSELVVDLEGACVDEDEAAALEVAQDADAHLLHEVGDFIGAQA
jgi:hypothetical protein